MVRATTDVKNPKLVLEVATGLFTCPLSEYEVLHPILLGHVGIPDGSLKGIKHDFSQLQVLKFSNQLLMKGMMAVEYGARSYIVVFPKNFCEGQ